MHQQINIANWSWIVMEIATKSTHLLPSCYHRTVATVWSCIHSTRSLLLIKLLLLLTSPRNNAPVQIVISLRQFEFLALHHPNDWGSRWDGEWDPCPLSTCIHSLVHIRLLYATEWDSSFAPVFVLTCYNADAYVARTWIESRPI